MVSAGTIARGQQHVALDAVLAGRDPVRACAPAVAARAAVGAADVAFERYVASLPGMARGRRVAAARAVPGAAAELRAACLSTPVTGI
jgi:hypothetical protein